MSNLERLEEKIDDLKWEVDKIKSERLTYVDILGWILGGGIVIVWGDKIWNFIKGVFLLFTQAIYHVWENFFG